MSAMFNIFLMFFVVTLALYGAQSCNTYTASNHMLVGLNRKTVTASSYNKCLQECKSAKRFKCASGQYYSDYSEDNCILNSETRHTRPELYMSIEDNNIYFEPNC